MKKVKNILLVLQALVVIAIGVYLMASHSSGKKQAFVEVGKIYQEFALKQELEGKLEEVKNLRTQILDSLRTNLQKRAITLQSQENPSMEAVSRFQMEKEHFLKKEQEFKKDNAGLAEEYNRQVWTQLNQYVKDFGSTNGFEIIFGADGQGGMMYAREKLDVTDDLVVFANQQYKGEKG